MYQQWIGPSDKSFRVLKWVGPNDKRFEVLKWIGLSDKRFGVFKQVNMISIHEFRVWFLHVYHPKISKKKNFNVICILYYIDSNWTLFYFIIYLNL